MVARVGTLSELCDKSEHLQEERLRVLQDYNDLVERCRKIQHRERDLTEMAKLLAAQWKTLTPSALPTALPTS